MHLLGLLLVLLLHLLHSLWSGLLFRQLLMFLVLPLLEFLAILVLLRDHLFLLLLVFLVLLRVPRVRSEVLDGRLRMHCRIGAASRSHWRRASVRPVASPTLSLRLESLNVCA